MKSTGYLLAFDDADGNPKTWAMPSRILAGDGAAYWAALLEAGLVIAPGPNTWTNLALYIQSRNVAHRVRCVERVGWHEVAGHWVYVWPDCTFGPADTESVICQTEERGRNPFQKSGTLDEWWAAIGRQVSVKEIPGSLSRWRLRSRGHA